MCLGQGRSLAFRTTIGLYLAGKWLKHLYENVFNNYKHDRDGKYRENPGQKPKVTFV